MPRNLMTASILDLQGSRGDVVADVQGSVIMGIAMLIGSQSNLLIEACRTVNRVRFSRR